MLCNGIGESGCHHYGVPRAEFMTARPRTVSKGVS